MKSVARVVVTAVVAGCNALSVTAVVKAQSKNGECDPVLNVRNVYFSTMSKASRDAWLKLVNESNYDEAKRQGALDFPGYFDANYQSFDAKRRNSLHYQKSESESFEASQQFRVELPSDAVGAWRDCILLGRGLTIFVDDVRDIQTATVTVKWTPPEGLATLGAVVINERNIKAGADLLTVKEFFPGVDGRAFLLERKSAAKAITVTISGTAGLPGHKHSFSGRIYIPTKPVRLEASAVGLSDAILLNEKWFRLYFEDPGYSQAVQRWGAKAFGGLQKDKLYRGRFNKKMGCFEYEGDRNNCGYPKRPARLGNVQVDFLAIGDGAQYSFDKDGNVYRYQPDAKVGKIELEKN